MTGKTALIAGASGLVGGYCLDELLQSDAYDRVLAIVRRPLDRTHPRLRQIQVDFDDLHGLGSRLRADDVFCCLGTTMGKAGGREAFRKVDLEYPLSLGRVCRQQGSRQFALVSSLGANARARIAFYSRVKGEVEAALDELRFTTLLVFRPSLLLGERGEIRWGERIAQVTLWGAAPLLRVRLRKYLPVHAQVVGRAMVVVASRGLEGRHTFESDRIQEAGRIRESPSSGV